MSSKSNIYYRSELAQKLLYLDGQPFSLENYPFYTAIYDGLYKRTLLKTGRQVAKTVEANSYISLYTGKAVKALDVNVGDEVVTLDTPLEGTKFQTSKVVWKSEIFQKECVKIKTRQGHELTMALTHPLRIWRGWKKGADLCVGDKIAVARKAGKFTGTCSYTKERVILTAYLIGDGYIPKDVSYTQLPGETLEEFKQCITDIGGSYHVVAKAKTKAVNCRVWRNSKIHEWLLEDGLIGKKSETKFIPSWVFDLSKEDTALFINRLWSTDGCVVHNGKQLYTLEYCSISSQIAYDLQRLLLKFGVPSKVRKCQPKVYKGTDKYVYKLRVETYDGVKNFLEQIGAKGKSEKITLVPEKSNPNRDTYPNEINFELKEIAHAADLVGQRGRYAEFSLHAIGLKRPKNLYRITKTKLEKYIKFFNEHGCFDKIKVESLSKHLDTDVYWDEIISVETVGIQDCIDFEIEGTHNYLSNGIVSHNSTTLANFMISDSIGQPFFKTYYISPSQEQTRKFSHTRVGKTLNYSADIRKTFLSDTIDNVYLRILNNGSEMAFTFADDDPDRARGYSADRCMFDEVQQMQYEAVIPVIEECMSNSQYAYSMYCGTPKTVENTIEFLWSLSTQSEWVMKCDGCNKHVYIVSDKCFGKHGPECLNCRKPLNPRLGKWVDIAPKANIKGFHISQPILPENVPAAWNSESDKFKAQERWNRILVKHGEYGQTKFDNEVLGISNAVGSRLFVKEELEALCDEDHHLSRMPTSTNLNGINRTFAGIDWSGSPAEIKGSEGLVKSRTVLTIWGEQADGKLKILYHRIYPDGHCLGWIDDICEVVNAYNCVFIVGDCGEGALSNSILRDRLGAQRAQQVRYGSAAKAISWNQDNRAYFCDRTTVIDSFALAIKKKQFVYASKEEMAPAIKDILAVYEETTISGKKVFRHSPVVPDDSLHAQVFGWIGYKILSGDLTFYT